MRIFWLIASLGLIVSAIVFRNNMNVSPFLFIGAAATIALFLKGGKKSE